MICNFSDGLYTFEETLSFEMKLTRFLIQFTVIIALISAAIQYIRSRRIPDDLIFVNGFVEPGFENVKEVFR